MSESLGKQMMRPAPIAKWAASAVIAVAILASLVLYGTPWLKSDHCKELAVLHLAAHPVYGIEIASGDSVFARPEDVDAHVSGPFEVEVDYAVPEGMHARVYSHSCVTKPFSVFLGPRRETSTF